jgi:hypothetical protein
MAERAGEGGTAATGDDDLVETISFQVGAAVAGEVEVRADGRADYFRPARRGSTFVRGAGEYRYARGTVRLRFRNLRALILRDNGSVATRGGARPTLQLQDSLRNRQPARRPWTDYVSNFVVTRGRLDQFADGTAGIPGRVRVLTLTVKALDSKSRGRCRRGTRGRIIIVDADAERRPLTGYGDYDQIHASFPSGARKCAIHQNGFANQVRRTPDSIYRGAASVTLTPKIGDLAG